MMKPLFFSLAAWRSTSVEGGASSGTDFFTSPACRGRRAGHQKGQ